MIKRLLSYLLSFPASPLGMQTTFANRCRVSRYSRRHSQRGRWERVGSVLKVCLVLLPLGLSPAVFAKFEFSGYNATAISVSESNDLIPYSFTVTYRPFQGDNWRGNNAFANYRIGLSDLGIHDNSRLTYTELEKVFDWSSVKVYPSQGSPSQAPVNATGWTHGQGSGMNPGSGVADFITATVEVKLKPQGLRDLHSAGRDLEFYVHGEELSGTTFFEEPHSEQLISIHINYPANARVSGLKDIPLVGDNPGINGYYQRDMEFCVYISRAPRSYRIGFLSGNGNDFTLRHSSGASLNYTMQFAGNLADLDTATEHTGRFIARMGDGSDSLDCNSYTTNNAAVRVKLNKTAADAAADGVYQDTVTVIVQAN